VPASSDLSRSGVSALSRIFLLLEERMDEKIQKTRVQSNSCGFGLVWIGSWLFTVGFLHLSFWKGVLAIVIWPYYIGAHFAAH
jgi:hypothetical protein